MKCSNCGFEIPEGHMYCDHCGTEINFVPDFEPEVENEINATLSGVADELNKEERLKEEKRKKREAFLKALTTRGHLIVLGVFILIAILFVGTYFYSFSKNSPHSYLRAAEASKNAGDMNAAILKLCEGNDIFPANSEIIFRLSDYYLEIGDSEKAVEALKKITDSTSFSEETKESAYESIISVYKSNEDYESIAKLLENSNDETVSAMMAKYVPVSPSIEPVSGEYDDSISIIIKNNDTEGKSDLYYTVNGGDPTASSILYKNEIFIDEPGEYVIKAVCINEYGVASTITEGRFTVNEGLPSAPEILEPSGEYNQNTMIVAVAEAGCTIFYTTDGTDPTIDSKQYISPITMPVGTTHFKFVAINADGESSEVVERNYHLVFTRLVSTEQAVYNLVSTLVRLDYLLDNTGKVRGLEGHNEYIYKEVIEIAGAGEYYLIVENYVGTDGSSAPTGLLYAVNTHDGTVNRLGYDSSGKYTLLTISNR